VPGNNSYSNALRKGKKVALFSDSICNRMSKHELRKTLQCDINKKSFPGATSVDIHESYMLPTLKRNTPDLAFIHIGVNDILHASDADNLTSENIEQISRDIIKCGEVCKQYGVNKVCFSSIIHTKHLRGEKAINLINNQVARLCARNSFDFILNSNVPYDEADKSHSVYYSDGLHLNDHGRDILMSNYKLYLDNHD